MSAPLNFNEVRIDNKNYPIVGTVQEESINVFAPKITFGDQSRESNVVKSSWFMSSWSGGLGVVHGDDQRHQDRYNFALAETRFPRQLGLLPGVIDHGELPDPVNHIRYYAGNTVFFSGGSPHTIDSTDTFTSFGNLPTNPLATSNYKGHLWAALGSSYPIERYDGVEWIQTEPLDSQEGILGGDHLLEFEDKLVTMTGDHRLFWTLDGFEWTEGGQLQLAPGMMSQLIVYYDRSEFPAIHAITREGVFGYDFDSGMWMLTPLTYPLHPFIGKACVWQGDLYVPVGLDVYRYNGQSITSMGPSKDEGMPPEYEGYIAELIPGHPYFFAIVRSVADVQDEIGEQLFEGSPWRHAILPEHSTRGLLLCCMGLAWHAIWESEEGINTATVSTGENDYRLWWSSGSKIHSMTIPSSLHNPLRNTAQTFQESGYVISPWFEANLAEMDKLVTNVEVSATELSPTEGYELRIQFDSSNDPWINLGTSNEDQRQKFDVRYQEGGRIFQRCRLRIDLYRGSDSSKSPIIDHIAVSFMRTPPVMFSYSFALDLSKPYEKRTPRDMRREIKDLMRSRKVFNFQYRDPEDSTDYVSRVAFSRDTNVRLTGRDARGVMNLSLIEVDDR